jgi:tetratricopeptide (TPR) repeat protein
LYYQARECFQVCTKLESFNPEPYVEIARTYLEQNNYSEALTWAERAVGADGKADFQDFDTLFFICIIHWRSGQFENIDKTVQRIVYLLPANEEARKYAAARFFNMGLDIFKFGIKQVNYGLFRSALKFLQAARDFDDNDIEIKDLYKNVELVTLGFEQIQIIREDSTIIDSLKSLAEFILADCCYYFELSEDKNTIYDNLMAEIFATSPNLILDSVRKIKSNYPAVYQLNNEIFGQIEQAIYQWYVQQSPANSNSFSGIGKEIAATLKKWLKWR